MDGFDISTGLRFKQDVCHTNTGLKPEGDQTSHARPSFYHTSDAQTFILSLDFGSHITGDLLSILPSRFDLLFSCSNFGDTV
jgi:hypothetical protein